MSSFLALTLLSLLVLAAFIGGLVSWVSVERIKALQKRVAHLEGQLQTSASPAGDAKAEPTATTREKAAREGVHAQATAPAPAPRWLVQLRDSWMIWLGGLCVALAGIFLVKYSIDQGWLGPAARIVLAVVIGLVLHAAAEWLRRRTGESHPSFAALAGGASITLYAAMLAALHLYQLLPPGVVFALLAGIALATMALSLVHGPVLAIGGLLGAYVVPLLVYDDSGKILTVMIYALIISAAALLLMRWIYRPWLWFGMVAGGLGWWGISLTAVEADGFRGFYLAALAYGMLAIPQGKLSLDHDADEPERDGIRLPSPFNFRLRALPMSLTLVTVALALSIASESFSSDALLRWSPLVIVLLAASRARPAIAFTPWLSLGCQWFAWLWCGMIFSGTGLQLLALQQATQEQFGVFAAGMAALYSGASWWLIRRYGFTQLRSSLLAMAPVCWLALAYLLVTDLSVTWQWSLVSLALGLSYIILAQRHLQRDSRSGSAIWLILGAHLAYSLAVAMVLREATLTLALATQLISLAWLIRKFELPSLDWLVKAVLALIVVRLTLNPWLLTYPTDVHWSLWTYGGSMLCCVVAAQLVPPGRILRRWLEAVSLQLLVLFVAAETRYWLYDGQIFMREYSLTEAAINTALWSLLGLVYHRRASLSAVLRPFYVAVSSLLMVMAWVNYLIVLSALNPLWSGAGFSATPVFNLLLLAYGLPPIIALAIHLFYRDEAKTMAGMVAGGGFLIFITMEIRHLWQRALDIRQPVMDGELYTYSVVWMLLAVAAVLYGGARRRETIYKGGMALLLVVMAKVFLIDMSGLQGLWRVASFMGLGLSLLALAYLYQRVGPDGDKLPSP